MDARPLTELVGEVLGRRGLTLLAALVLLGVAFYAFGLGSEAGQVRPFGLGTCRAMPRVVIVPTVPEWGIAPASYEDLARALRDQGYDARVEPPGRSPGRRGEFRHVLSDVVHAGADVAIVVGGHITDVAIGALVTTAMGRLRRKTKRRRRGVIYGPDGRVLRTFELPPSDDEDDQAA